MRWHVVGPLVVVAIKGDILRHQPSEKHVKITQHVRRSVLLDQQRGRGVLEVDRQEPEPNVLAFDPARDFGGDFLDLAGGGFDRQPGLDDAHGWVSWREQIWISGSPSATGADGLSSPRIAGENLMRSALAAAA